MSLVPSGAKQSGKSYSSVDEYLNSQEGKDALLNYAKANAENNLIAFDNKLIDYHNNLAMQQNQLITQQNIINAANNGIDKLGNQDTVLKNQLIQQQNTMNAANYGIDKLAAQSDLKKIVMQGMIGNATEFDIYNKSGAKVGSIPANANSYDSLKTLLDTGEPLSIRASNPLAEQKARDQSLSNLASLKSYIAQAHDDNVKSMTLLGPSKIGGAFDSQGTKIGTTTPDNALRDILGYGAKGQSVGLSYQPPAKPATGPWEDIRSSIKSSPFGNVASGAYAGIMATNAKSQPVQPFTGGLGDQQKTIESFVGTKTYQPPVADNGFFSTNLLQKNPQYVIAGVVAAVGVGALTVGLPGAGKAIGLGSDAIKAGQNIAKETPAFEAITTKTARTYPTYAATNMMRTKLPNDLLSLDTKVGREPVSATIPIPKNPQFEDVTHETISKSLKIQNDLLLPTEKVPMFKQAVPQSDLILKGETGKGGKPLFGSSSPIKITDHNTNEIANLYGKANGKAPIEKITDLTTNSISPLSRLNIGKQFTGSYPKSYLPPVPEMPKVFEQTPPEITNPLGRRGKPPVDITSIQEQGVKEFYSDILNRQFKPEETLTASGKPGNINNPFINILEKSTPKISNGIKSKVNPTDLSEFFIRPGKIDTERLLGIEQPTIGESEGRLKDIMKAVNARNERENPSETTARTPINTPDIDRFVPNSQDFKKSMKDIGLDIKGMFTETKINLGKGIGFPYSKGGSTKLGFDINKPTNPFDALGPKNKPKGESKGKGNQFLIQIEKEATKTLENEVKSGGYREDNIALGTGKGSLIINQNTEKIGISGLLGGTKTDQANKKYLESLTGRKQSRIYEESQVIAFPQGTKSELIGKQIQTNDIMQLFTQKEKQAQESTSIFKLNTEFKQGQKNIFQPLNLQTQIQGNPLIHTNIQTTFPIQTPKQGLQTSPFPIYIPTSLHVPLTVPDIIPVPKIPLIPTYRFPPNPPPGFPGFPGGKPFRLGGYFGSGGFGGKKSKKKYELTYESTDINVKYLEGTDFLKESSNPNIFKANDAINRKAIARYNKIQGSNSLGDTLSLFGSSKPRRRKSKR